MDSDLLATCNALGYLEEERYFKDPNCLDTVKCLIRYLHQEDNNHDIRIQLGSGHVVKNDLLPILRQYPDDDALCAAVLRLLVNLTQPALLCFDNKIPKEVDQYHNYLDVLSHNQAYKQDFSSEETWKVLAQKVYDILEKDWEDRTPDDSMTVERILILCRNVLHVPATTEDENQTSANESTHDKLVIAMHNAGIDSMILYLASSNEEQQWCLHVAEIISLLLKEQNAGDLAALNNAREREREGDELREMRLQEERKKKMRVLQQSSRHSRFGGTYVAKGKAALVDTNDLILHKSVQKCNSFSFDEGKNKRRKAKFRRPLTDDRVKHHTTREVREILKEFCINLLENGYNHLMYNIRDKISREKSEDHDETYYFNIMSFILEFNRRHQFHIDQVSETIQIATLHFIDTSIVNCMELMMTDKEACKTWGKRMHHALRSYKEFLLTLQQMQVSRNEGFAESAKVLLNNLFYTSEYRDLFLIMLKKYDESKLSHSFLDDLIQTCHLFLRLFEHYCKGNSVVVQKKGKKKKKKQKKSNNSAAAGRSTLSEEEKNNCWIEIEDGVKDATQSGELPEPRPVSDIFDPTSDVSEEEQQQKVLVKLQNILHAKSLPESVVLLRQARQLWPEINIFGASDSTWEDDVSTLKEICLADMAGLPGEDQLIQEEIVEEEDEEEVMVSSKEVQFNFNDYMRKFVDHKIVWVYSILLAKFDTNTQHTNHCIVKFLHRVAYDLKMYGLLFQASIFRCFQRIFKASKLDPNMKELAGFAKYIIRQFFEVLPRNDKLFAEMLFWKQSTSQVYELTEGYGTFAKTQGGSKQVISWSEAEQDELLKLFEEFKDGELDVVDCILARITDESRTRRQVVRQLLDQGLVEDISSLKRKKGPRGNIWREHEEMELRTLFDEYRDSEDPITNIMQMMSSKKSKPKVIEKILAMGLVQDRKELYKRRKRNAAPKNNKGGSEIIHAGGSDSEVDDNDEPEGQDSESDDDSWALIDLSSCIRKASSDGFQEQISWVKSNLEQAIEDREQSSEDIQPLPLVPLTEEQEDAMQNSAFRKMLHFIGLHKPSAGQEMFWRIPPSISIEQLQDSIEVLSRPHKKLSPEKMSRPEDVLAAVLNDGPGTSGVKRKRISVSDDDEDIGTKQGHGETASLPEEENKHKKRKRISAADDDDSNSDAESGKDTALDNNPGSALQDEASSDVSKSKTSSRLFMHSDEDDDYDGNKENERKDAVLSENIDDEETHVSFQRKHKRRIAILDDDDDEE